MNSALALTLIPSIDGLVLDELLVRRRLLRASSGSAGDRPLARASKLSTSVKLTTPDKRPDMLTPGNTLALTVEPGMPSLPEKERDVLPVRSWWLCEEDGGLKGGTWCTNPGDGGMLLEGDGASTIHMRCERVAQSLATVWASVLKGVTCDAVSGCNRT